MPRRPLITALYLLFVLSSQSASAAEDAVIDALIESALSSEQKGDYAARIEKLNQAVAISKENDYFRHAFICGKLAAAYVQTGDAATAGQYLREGITTIDKTGIDRELEPLLHNDLGGVYRELGDFERARHHYQTALERAGRYNNHELEFAAAFNTLLLPVHSDGRSRQALYEHAAKSAAAIENAEIRAGSLSRLGILSLHDHEENKSKTGLNRAVSLFNRAITEFNQNTQSPLLQEALGQSGKAYTLLDDIKTAESRYLQAVKGSIPRNDMEQLYRWYWGLARIGIRKDSRSEAVQYYDMAVAAHQNLYLGGNASLGDQAGLYSEFLSLLLDAPDADKPVFEKAIRTLENLRTAAIQDYFRDRCVAETKLNIANITDIIGPGAAIIYPLILNDRLRVLLVTENGYHQQISSLSRNDLAESAAQLRSRIKADDDGYIQQSRLLFGALIGPFVKILAEQRISHLIIVPDHLSASVPYAALLQGDRFLLEDFSVSIAPSLELTQLDRATLRKSRALYAGISLPVSNMPALQHVRDEITLASHFIPGETLLNTGFSTAAVNEKLAPGDFGILHLASHSHIADDVEDSFILTFDGKITLNNLQDLLGGKRYSQNPVQLLSLSACSTAEGSQRAALGLAGLAVKSGAHSVLASLWAIGDEATARLVAEFYKQLAAGEGKAQALRTAQLSLLHNTRFEHPNNWAAFVLVGDWH